MRSCLKRTPPPSPPPLIPPLADSISARPHAHEHDNDQQLPSPTSSTSPSSSHVSSNEPSPAATPSLSLSSRKSVKFCEEESNEVWVADEWDRSPAEVTPRLNYRDLLELKQIQFSLPRAQQPPDPFLPASRPNRPQYLRHVPIPLVPLLPSSTATAPTPAPTPVHSPLPSHTGSPVTSQTGSPLSSRESSRDVSPVSSPPGSPSRHNHVLGSKGPSPLARCYPPHSPPAPPPAPSIPGPSHPPSSSSSQSPLSASTTPTQTPPTPTMPSQSLSQSPSQTQIQIQIQTQPSLASRMAASGFGGYSPNSASPSQTTPQTPSPPHTPPASLPIPFSSSFTTPFSASSSSTSSPSSSSPSSPYPPGPGGVGVGAGAAGVRKVQGSNLWPPPGLARQSGGQAERQRERPKFQFVALLDESSVAGGVASMDSEKNAEKDAQKPGIGLPTPESTPSSGRKNAVLALEPTDTMKVKEAMGEVVRSEIAIVVTPCEDSTSTTSSTRNAGRPQTDPTAFSYFSIPLPHEREDQVPLTHRLQHAIQGGAEEKEADVTPTSTATSSLSLSLGSLGASTSTSSGATTESGSGPSVYTDGSSTSASASASSSASASASTPASAGGSLSPSEFSAGEGGDGDGELSEIDLGDAPSLHMRSSNSGLGLGLGLDLDAVNAHLHHHEYHHEHHHGEQDAHASHTAAEPQAEEGMVGQGEVEEDGGREGKEVVEEEEEEEDEEEEMQIEIEGIGECSSWSSSRRGSREASVSMEGSREGSRQVSPRRPHPSSHQQPPSLPRVGMALPAHMRSKVDGVGEERERENGHESVQLKALPSPVLIPPSPFSLYPSETETVSHSEHLAVLSEADSLHIANEVKEVDALDTALDIPNEEDSLDITTAAAADSPMDDIVLKARVGENEKEDGVPLSRDISALDLDALPSTSTTTATTFTSSTSTALPVGQGGESRRPMMLRLPSKLRVSTAPLRDDSETDGDGEDSHTDYSVKGDGAEWDSHTEYSVDVDLEDAPKEAQEQPGPAKVCEGEKKGEEAEVSVKEVVSEPEGDVGGGFLIDDEADEAAEEWRGRSASRSSKQKTSTKASLSLPESSPAHAQSLSLRSTIIDTPTNPTTFSPQPSSHSQSQHQPEPIQQLIEPEPPIAKKPIRGPPPRGRFSMGMGGMVGAEGKSNKSGALGGRVWKGRVGA